MEAVNLSLNSLPPDIAEGLDCKLDLGISTTEEIVCSQESGYEILNIKVEETSPLDSLLAQAEDDEAPDPTFVTHAFNQQLNLNKKKVKSKEEKLEIRRTKKVQRELEKSLQVPSRKAKSLKKDPVNCLKRRQLFRDEFLELRCEWKDCLVQESRMEDFMRHVAGHCKDAEVRHNPPPLFDTFACLWQSCGFETINSHEMVRHINFHSFHTKIKCHGQNMLQVNQVLPCRLDPDKRNVLPDLSGQFRSDLKYPKLS